MNTEPVFQAMSYPRELDAILFGPRKEYLLIASFSSGCYAYSKDGSLLALHMERFGSGPFHIPLSAPLGSFATYFPKGAPLVVCEGTVSSENCVVYLDKGLQWTSSWKSVEANKGAGNRIAELYSIYAQHANPESLGYQACCARSEATRQKKSYAEIHEFACIGWDYLLDGWISGSETLLVNGAQYLAGLGAGLTPSGDDILCGSLLGAHLLWRILGGPKERMLYLCDVLNQFSSTRTGCISASYLDSAAKGDICQPVDELLCYILSGKGIPETLTKAVLSCGASTGHDLLAAVLTLTLGVIEMEEQNYGIV